MANRTRPTIIRFAVTEEEKKLIKQKMRMLGTKNMGAYLRKIAIDGYIINVDHTDIKNQTYEINKIGVNINQIAHRMNQTLYVHPDDIKEIKELMNKIWQLQRHILSRKP